LLLVMTLILFVAIVNNWSAQASEKPKKLKPKAKARDRAGEKPKVPVRKKTTKKKTTKKTTKKGGRPYERPPPLFMDNKEPLDRPLTLEEAEEAFDHEINGIVIDWPLSKEQVFVAKSQWQKNSVYNHTDEVVQAGKLYIEWNGLVWVLVKKPDGTHILIFSKTEFNDLPDTLFDICEELQKL
jgi:uncharacterized membrane protein YkoI